MPDLLTPMQQDALCEIFNIGVGQSAAAMSELTGEEVSLSVPSLRICSIAELNERVGMRHWHHVGAVAQHFEGSFKGDALFLFPDDDGNELARNLLSNQLDIREKSEALMQDAISEIGNILINACLSALADLMHEEFQYSIPSYCHGRAIEILRRSATDPDTAILFVYIQFLVDSERVEGSFCFLISAKSLEGLLHCVDCFIGKISEPPKRQP